jgi:hypothetical protein
LFIAYFLQTGYPKIHLALQGLDLTRQIIPILGILCLHTKCAHSQKIAGENNQTLSH